MPLKGDTEPWRDIGHARWFDPWAALEDPASPAFKDAVRDENARWTAAVAAAPNVKRWLHAFQRFGTHALPNDPHYAHIWYTWNGINVRIQYTPGHRKSVWFDGKQVHKDCTEFDTDPESDLYYTIADVGNGDETLELRVYRCGAQRPVWTKKPVGPTAAFVGNVLYYQTVENQLRYPGIIQVQKRTGGSAKQVFHERDPRFQVELVKHSGQRDVFFVIANALTHRIGHIPFESVHYTWMTPHTESSLWPIKKDVWLSDSVIHYGNRTVKLPKDQHVVEALPCPQGIRIVTTHQACNNLYVYNESQHKFDVEFESSEPNQIHITESTTLYHHPAKPTRVVGTDGQCVDFPEPLRLTFSKHGQVKSRDGTHVPYTMVSSNANPTFLIVEGYGSYGISCHRSYPIHWLPWLERGAALVVAAPRGGREDGDAWYDGGRTAQRKQNTFNDVAAVIQAAQRRLKLSPHKTIFYGRSAGGLLAANIAHQYYSLVSAVYAEVPYVDVLRTTTNPALPLTRLEYDEFGDPCSRPEDYDALQRISPVDTVPIAPTNAPFVLVRTGVHDAQVLPYEALKWAKKLRAAGWTALVGIDGAGGHFAAADVMYGQQAEDAAILMAHLTQTKNKPFYRMKSRRADRKSRRRTNRKQRKTMRRKRRNMRGGNGGEIHNARTLANSLLALPHNDEPIDIQTAVSFLRLYNDRTPSETDLSNLDARVRETMAVLEPESENVYADFYKYFADGDKIAEFESRIIEKVDECWEDILKTFKDEVNVVNVNDELGEVDEDALKNAIQSTYLAYYRSFSIASTDVMHLFKFNDISANTQPMYNVFSTYKELM